MRCLPTTGRQERGATLVEFALVIPLLILILVGVFDLGWAVYAQNTLSLAVREGARVGIVSTNEGAVKQTVVDRAIGLGLTTGQVQICYAANPLTPVSFCAAPSGTRTAGGRIIVSGVYTYAPLTPVIGNIVGTGGSIILQGQATMVVECQYCQ